MTSVILGASTPAQLEENLQAVAVAKALTPELRAEIDAVLGMDAVDASKQARKIALTLPKAEATVEAREEAQEAAAAEPRAFTAESPPKSGADSGEESSRAESRAESSRAESPAESSRAESSRGESRAPGTRPTSAAPSEAPSMTASEAAEQVLNQTAEDIAAEMSPQVGE